MWPLGVIMQKYTACSAGDSHWFFYRPQMTACFYRRDQVFLQSFERLHKNSIKLQQQNAQIIQN